MASVGGRSIRGWNAEVVGADPGWRVLLLVGANHRVMTAIQRQLSFSQQQWKCPRTWENSRVLWDSNVLDIVWCVHMSCSHFPLQTKTDTHHDFRNQKTKVTAHWPTQTTISCYNPGWTDELSPTRPPYMNEWLSPVTQSCSRTLTQTNNNFWLQPLMHWYINDLVTLALTHHPMRNGWWLPQSQCP